MPEPGELWVRRTGAGGCAVVGWRRGDRAWRIAVVGPAPAAPGRGQGVDDLDRMLADDRPGGGAPAVVLLAATDGDDPRGDVDLDPALVGAHERWIGRAAVGLRSADPGVVTWRLGTDGCVPDTPGTDPRPARFVTASLGRAVVTVVAPAPGGERPLASLAAAGSPRSTEPDRPTGTGFAEGWVWSHRKLRAVLAEQVRHAEQAGAPARPQPSLKDLGDLVNAVRGEAGIARAALAVAVARTTQPVVVVETGVGTVVLGGSIPPEMWRHLAHGEDGTVGTVRGADLLVAVPEPAPAPAPAAAQAAGDAVGGSPDEAGGAGSGSAGGARGNGQAAGEATWPPACLLADGFHLAAAVGLDGTEPWIAPAGRGRLAAATTRDGTVTEVRLTRPT
jgi:hypothetical protein